MKRALLFLLTLPMNLSGYLVLGLVLLFRGGERVPVTGVPDVLCVAGRHGGRLERWWSYSTTFSSRCVYLHPTATAPTILHELKHTSQAEGVSCAWAFATLLSWNRVMLALWPLCWLIVYGGASLAAWLRGRHPYRGNEYERQAYQVQHVVELQLQVAADRARAERRAFEER